MPGVSLKALVVAVALALFVGIVTGYGLGMRKADILSARAVAKAADDNRKLNDEVINGWAAAVNSLRARLRDGSAPRIPVPGTATPPGAAGGTDGRPADDVSIAGKLATCRAERQRLIEDAALTTIQLRELQNWAR